MQIREWKAQIEAQQASGLIVQKWFAENGVNLKTYYYRLKRVRLALCNEVETHDIVVVNPRFENERQEVY